MLEKSFVPQDVEGDIYQKWLKLGVFECQPGSEKPGFSVMMPPPNVTGVLHLGHALNSTIQDIIVRFKRQKGFDVLWQPGTDHAGIATQIVVERELKKENLTRHDLGREKFIERVWKWREESGTKIFHQMQRLGISPDWKRARFTMDEGLSRAVKKIFVQLYNDKLIYRDKRLVNWDSVLQTAISDLEVDNRPQKGKLYHIAYRVEGESEPLVVATTRPETFFGDTAIAVNPEDPRFAPMIGKKAYLPLTDRPIPIIGDDHCDMEFGTGALKVTPAHDFNDFNIGKRHNLEFLNILNRDGTLNENVSAEFQGLRADDARKLVLEALTASGSLLSEEVHTNSVPYSERTDVRVEPFLTDQWFVDTESLAKRALKAVEEGETQFLPKSWENTYFEWLRNIQPWCISRQIWWGHQIPAYFGPDGEIFVAESAGEANELAEKHYGKKVELIQDEDVLDTWFSSGLWAFSTLGWPEQTPELAKYYPTSLLVTGFDIIFFWVARMMMMSLYTQNQIPFEKVYIHALVRDEKGQKMSKSKGNIIDPLELMDKYGADALRFTLSILAAPGRDVKIGPSRVETYRNFLTKIWNAARFLMMQEGWIFDENFDPASSTLTISKWIVGEVIKLTQDVEKDLEEFRFDYAASKLYHFVWGTFCDYFLEFLKPILNGDNTHAREEVLNVAFWVFARFITLLHPMIPFMTEHLWAAIGGKGMLCEKAYPTDIMMPCETSISIMNHLMEVITNVRRMRSDYNVAVADFVDVMAVNSPIQDAMYIGLIQRMGRVKTYHQVESHSPNRGDVIFTVDQVPYYIQLQGIVDLEKEKSRIEKDIQKLESDHKSWSSKLDNPEFASKAKPEIIEEFRERIASAASEIQQKQHALKALG